MTLEVVPVTKREEDAFLRLPWRLYRDDPAWVPNLLLLQRDVIAPKKNPFFEHGEAQLFLARRDGVPVGRISAQVDHHHNDYTKEKTGFFGFFETEDNAETAAALVNRAEAWLRQRGLERVRGPFSFTMNEEVGVLVEGFEHPPFVAMPHALPYYDAHLHAQGYAKAMDLLAYRWDIQAPPERMMKAVERARAYPGLKLRKVSILHALRDVEVLLDIYNDAWSDNWRYVPATRSEARKMAGDLRLIADANLAIIAEIDGEPAGMIVGIPNLYEAIRDFRGFLSPWNAARLVWRLKIRGVETGRVMIFGIKKEFRHQRDLVGLPFLLLDAIYRGAQKGRYTWGEMSWVLENNGPLNALMTHWDAQIYKRYRIYEKAL